MKGWEFRNLIETVVEQTDIAQVIGERIDLDRNHKALCPFREEKNPSFSVNPEEQYFYCFGCGTGGDVIRFVQLYEGKTFWEALSDLAQRAGVPIPNLDGADRGQIEEAQHIGDILTATAQFYHKNLTPEAKTYLTDERGFTQETINHFRIGYASGGLREHLIDEYMFPSEICIKAGVLKRTEEGTVRDYFYRRIIFPNVKRGRVVHLSGKSLDGSQPKYLHLPGEIKHLYNEDAVRNEEVCVVEGITDCISTVQAGFPAVAILGSHNFKPEYVPKLRCCSKVNLCFDGDKAGQEGALKAAQLLGDRARIVVLPEGTDPNEYFVSHTKEDFSQLLLCAKDPIKHQLDLIPSDTEKTELPERLGSVLEQLSKMERVKADAHLYHDVKARFGLKSREVDGYRELIDKLRREKHQAPNVKASRSDTDCRYTALFDGLVDLVDDKGKPAFLVKEGNEPSVTAQVQIEGVTYVPPPKEQIPWLLPRADAVLRFYELQTTPSVKHSDAVLYDDLLTYHKSISQLPGEEYYDLVLTWALHTYLLEDVQYSPIICLFAVPERGKTRTGKGMINVAYRGVHVECLRDAYIVRMAKNFQASLFFDVKSIWRKAEKNGTEDILLQRFEKGALVPRVLFPERGPHRDTVYYNIFGPTVISTNEGVHRILETRAIPIYMPEATREFENDVSQELSLPLKERLVAFRARHVGEAPFEMPKPAPGRLGDILKPLLQIIHLVRPERKQAFLNLIRELQQERLIEKADTFEAGILATIVSLDEHVDKGVLPVKTITDTYNAGKSERSQITYQRVGKQLKAMGFKKCKTGSGAAAIIWDDNKIEQMRATYGLKETSETSDTSESSTPEPNDADVSDDTDVCRNLF